MAYRYILGRDPESAAVLAEWIQPTRDREELRNALLNSAEFATLRGGPPPEPAKAAKWAAVEVFDGQRLLWLDLADDFVSRGCLNDSFEPTETSFVKSLVGDGDVFLDIGANVGWFTMLASTLVGKHGQVIAFEPRQSAVEHLKRSVAMNDLNDMIVVHGYALGHRDARAKLAWEKGARDSGNSYLTQTPEDGKPGEMVEERRLDALALRRIDFVKIDAAGAERRAFEGALSTLKRCRPIVMSTLDEPMLRRVSGCGAREYLGGFAQLGYECYSLDNSDFGRLFVGLPVERTEVALIPREKLELVRSRLLESGKSLESWSFARGDGEGRSGLTRDQVREAFVLLLRREPKSETEYKAHESLPAIISLRRVITASAEFRALDAARKTTSERETFVQIHIEKTGGTSLYLALAERFPPGSVTEPTGNDIDALSAEYENPNIRFFSGHFDFETAVALPGMKKKMISLFRDPRDRLLSFYRFQRTHSEQASEEADPLINLARKLGPLDFFRHSVVRNSERINNRYLSAFAGTYVHPVAHLSDSVERANDRLQLALRRVRGLDGVGVLEHMSDSIISIFVSLGLEVPNLIPSANRTDENAKINNRLSDVPYVKIDADLDEALRDLVKYDDVIYAAAKDELSRRMAERSQK